jgi:hypothetical protein
MKVPGILKNKYVCYALMALAALNVIGYLTVKAWECLALFVLAGYSAHCYCKDKSCAILAALFVANFVFGCGRVKEGFEEALKEPEQNMADAKAKIDKAGQQSEQCGDHKTAEACAKLADMCEFVEGKCQEKSNMVPTPDPNDSTPDTNDSKPDPNDTNTPPTDGSTGAGFGNIF